MSYLELFGKPKRQLPPPAPSKRKPAKPKPKVDGTRKCDLCGRNLATGKYGKPYAGEVWCTICVKHHKVYPELCVTCEGYHFKPGETLDVRLDDLEKHPIVLQVALLELGETSF